MNNPDKLDPKLPWRRCFLWRIFMLPLTMILIFLVIGFLPNPIERLVKAWLANYWGFSAVLFYLASVVLFRQLRFDFKRKEDWGAGL